MNRSRIHCALQLFFLSIIPAASAQSLIPATKISYSVSVSISFDSSTGGFSYGYQLLSAPSSEQNIWLFDVSIDTRLISVANIHSPNPDWEGIVAPRGAVDWAAIGDSSTISPGHSLTGFTFDSPNLPSVTACFAQGDVPLPKTSGFVDRNSPAPISFKNNVVYRTTVGPGTNISTSTESNVNFLITLKHQAASQDWLRGKELIDHLDDKLEQAKKALARGLNLEARESIDDFIRALDEQRERQLRIHRENEHEDGGKGSERQEQFLGDNAYFLLKPNAQFILTKLQARSSDQDRKEGDK